MLFYNIGDGYTSGCCTSNLYHLADEDPKYFGMHNVEHPDNREGSFVSHLAELYKARSIVVGHHRLTLEEMLDTIENYERQILEQQDQTIAFVGIPNLYSTYLKNKQTFELDFGPVSCDIDPFLNKYLLLDGKDNIGWLEKDQEATYNMMCDKKEQVIDLNGKVDLLQMFLERISTITKKIILFRTTHYENLNLDLPKNVEFLDESIVDILSENHKPYRRQYFDADAYKSLKGSFLKLL